MRTSGAFMDRWAAGTASWEDGFPDDQHPLWAVPAGDLRLPAPGAFTHEVRGAITQIHQRGRRGGGAKHNSGGSYRALRPCLGG